MPEHRFYIRQEFFCPECRTVLRWAQRPEVNDSMMLVHEVFPLCSRSNKKYYAPVQQLTEITTPDGSRP